MPLTPAEVRNVIFSKAPVGRRGYHEDEVDSFLDRVHVELAHLIEENNDLRGAARSAASRRTCRHRGQLWTAVC
ncbi:MAG: DivIVA domain-containing protein [Actinobacteria bacterium]|nr:DivIVA domain-containing protein [Actinomycetota bacterium]